MMTRKPVTMMTSDQMIFFASQPCGMSEPLEPVNVRLVARLVAAGFLVRRERTVTIPAMWEPEPGHAAAFGIDPAEHDATIVTYHAVRS